MWILENEGDALNGKKLWLRPGKRFLFGRTRSEDGQFVVADKTISRQHLTIDVESVTAADCANAKTRSRVTLKDLGTKIGTLVNGEQIRDKSYVLQQDKNVISLGKYKYHFQLNWVPIVFTFSFSTKEHNADPYTNLYKFLGPLDIKVLIEYDRENTTHLVAKKRNTSKGLQALINGKYVVHNDSFVNAVVAAATPNGEGLVPLEEDFEANLPDPLQYLPPKGDEPTQRDATAYEPNPNRQDIFHGYKFVFCEKRQFDTLLAPITEGRGKALLKEAIPNETTVDDFVQYVKNVAGEKGLGEFEDGSEGKGVVVVRFNPVKGTGTEWFADFGRRVAQRLDHRLIEQNEFLDAILGNDASVLRRPLEPALSGVEAPLSTAATAVTSQTNQISEPAPTQTVTDMAPPEQPRRARGRRGARPKFTGFEDDFSVPLSSAPESMVVDQPAESQSLFVSQSSEVEMDCESSQPAEIQTRTSRKRPASPIIEEEEDIMEEMAPAAAALKRRRLARGEPTPPPPLPRVKDKPAAVERPAKKAKKEIDVLEIARQQREKAEELAKVEREALQEQLEGMDIEEMRNLAEIEEIEVKRTYPVPRAAARADESERWDDKWNGRKNFKKFRRQGTEAGPVREKILVALEVVKKKDFGIGDEYWEDGDSQRRRKKDKGKRKETEDTSQMESQARPKSRAAERAAQILASEAEEEFGEVAKNNDTVSDSDLDVVEQPQKAVVATTSRSQRSQKLADKTRESQNLPAGNSKRAAEKVLTKQAPAKRARQTKLTKLVSDDSDDDDGLKFRFKKR